MSGNAKKENKPDIKKQLEKAKAKEREREATAEVRFAELKQTASNISYSYEKMVNSLINQAFYKQSGYLDSYYKKMNLIIDTLDGLQKETAENTKKLVDTVNGVDEMLETIKNNYTAAEAVLRSNSENLELLNDICGGDAKKELLEKDGSFAKIKEDMKKAERLIMNHAFDFKNIHNSAPKKQQTVQTAEPEKETGYTSLDSAIAIYRDNINEHPEKIPFAKTMITYSDGKYSFKYTADGEDFNYYTVQIGKKTYAFPAEKIRDSVNMNEYILIYYVNYQTYLPDYAHIGLVRCAWFIEDGSGYKLDQMGKVNITLY